MENEKDVLYCHLRASRPFGAVTAAYRVHDDHISVGFAFCNTVDNFCRSLGREIAKGRLNKKAIKIDRLHKNEHQKLEITKTLIFFLNDVTTDDAKDVESTLHVKPWRTRPADLQGNFLGWLRFFVRKLQFDMDRKKPQ